MWAKNIASQYTRQKLAKELQEKDLWAMSDYTYKIAINEAYKGIQENAVPSKEYVAFRFETCKKLVALAGYRLADFLNENL